MFVVLDAKFRFVCDKLDLYKSIEKSQNIITTTVASAAKFPCFPCVLSPNFLIFRDKENKFDYVLGPAIVKLKGFVKRLNSAQIYSYYSNSVFLIDKFVKGKQKGAAMLEMVHL